MRRFSGSHQQVRAGKNNDRVVTTIFQHQRVLQHGPVALPLVQVSLHGLVGPAVVPPQPHVRRAVTSDRPGQASLLHLGHGLHRRGHLVVVGAPLLLRRREVRHAAIVSVEIHAHQGRVRDGTHVLPAEEGLVLVQQVGGAGEHGGARRSHARSAAARDAAVLVVMLRREGARRGAGIVGHGSGREARAAEARSASSGRGEGHDDVLISR
mmetsp:Transcript_54962/g.116807  ORF Transcript_54962/g.116807 Transcript_54962/m.116807 type:complete len:210 (-) Transcript_54962:83-712(-)